MDRFDIEASERCVKWYNDRKEELVDIEKRLYDLSKSKFVLEISKLYNELNKRRKMIEAMIDNYNFSTEVVVISMQLRNRNSKARINDVKNEIPWYL